MENLIKIWVDNKPTLSFALLPLTDTTGHIYGHESDNYRQAIERADNAIGLLISKLKEEDAYQESLIVITADHGMTSTTHGSKSAGDMTIPLILSGPGIQPGELKDAEIIDVTPTISALFGLRAPKDTEGRNLFAQPAGVSMIYIAIGAGIILAVMLIIFIVRRRSREKTSEKMEDMSRNVNGRESSRNYLWTVHGM
ncbi:hypothetical protein AKJ48_02505 [candidate division MSBL1 archaeon SCGC-AAA261O19]|uniref:Metalloenzyme domain-containing protein n=2 Tax=candidate division MSBL1 TaxID=215777 RepID=A0A133UYA9_9EURY|nr:hypothetical protein AKJ42_03635 [candidate division MSBL1 archaeon SCGC-AAA261C02]KXB04466.1 hypothetical protein AKJ48_02505 [candidate division MSBL1 archaeon SCGC-AAA261O19]